MFASRFPRLGFGPDRPAAIVAGAAPAPSWTNVLLPWAYRRRAEPRRAMEEGLLNRPEDGAAAARPAPDG